MERGDWHYERIHVESPASVHPSYTRISMSQEFERTFPRPLSGARVDSLPSGLAPARRALEGRHVRLEPMDPAVHAEDLMIYKGLNRDTAWYSILDDEWTGVRAVIRDWLADDNFDRQGIARRSLTTMMAARLG